MAEVELQATIIDPLGTVTDLAADAATVGATNPQLETDGDAPTDVKPHDVMFEVADEE